MLKTIENYYANNNISIIGELKEAIDSGNTKACCWVKDSIISLVDVKGMPEFLAQLASININGCESERQFDNSLTELHAANFLAQELNENVVGIESKSHKIKSPFSKKNKYCDIKTKINEDEIFYEVKDASSEKMSSYKEKNVIHFEPMSDEKVEQWIKNKLKEVDLCGANYLICRVPIWLEDHTKEEDFYLKWREQVFRNLFEILQIKSKNEFYVAANFSLSSHVKGFYIIKSFGYIKMMIKNRKNSSNHKIEPTQKDARLI